MTETKLEEHQAACTHYLQLPVLLLHEKCEFYAEGLPLLKGREPL